MSHRSTNAFSMTKWPGSEWLPSRNPRCSNMRAQVRQHRRAAAQHDAVGLDVERRQPAIVEQLVGGDQVGDPAAIAERLAGHGGIVVQLVCQQRPEQFVVAQALDQPLAIGQLRHLPAAVHQHDLLVFFVDVGILDDARERRQAGAGGQQQQPRARQQVVGDQRPVALRPTSTVSPGWIRCSREVSGPSGTLMLKNSSDSSWLALAML